MAAELPRPGFSEETSKQRYVRKHRESGLCVDCSNPTICGKIRCGECVDRNNTRKAGSCRDCGKPSPDTSRCALCLEKVRKDYLRRVNSGQCVKCSEKATAGAFCFRHWLSNIGIAYKMSWRNGGLVILQQLWNEQDGHCAVTGTKLIPGHNASLDHIIAASKGGSDAKNNLRWVLDVVNKAKWDMTDEQFVELCRLVVASADSRKTSAKVIGLRSVTGDEEHGC